MEETPRYRHGGPVPDDDESGDDTESTDSLGERLPVVAGLAVGTGAIAITYLTTLVAVLSVRRGLGDRLEDEELPHLAIEAAWTVLINLGTELQADGEAVQAFDLTMTWNVLTFASSPVFLLGTFGVIVVAGYVVADYGRPETVPEAVVAALLVVPVYFVFAVTVATIATWSPTGEETIVGPSFSDAALYAGILVPALFAAIGGLLAIGRRTWVERRE